MLHKPKVQQIMKLDSSVCVFFSCGGVSFFLVDCKCQLRMEKQRGAK